MSFFGELYLHSTRPFFGPELNEREAEYLARVFAGAPEGPVVDLGCGHGRHVGRLQGRLGGRAAIGLELDALSLAEREGPFPAIRGDLRSLPLRTGSVAGAVAWYSTLFVFEDDATEAKVLSEVARILRPGGLLVLQTSRREHFESTPPVSFDTELPGGGRVKEINVFDGASGRSLGYRELVTPDGRVLSAPFAVRYYRVPELVGRMEAHGFTVRWVHGGVGGEPVSEGSRDLIMGVERNG